MTHPVSETEQRIADLTEQLAALDARLSLLMQQRAAIYTALREARSEHALDLLPDPEAAPSRDADDALLAALAFDSTGRAMEAFTAALTDLHPALATYTRWWPDPAGTGLSDDDDAWPLLAPQLSLYRGYAALDPANVDPLALSKALLTFAERFCPNVPIEAASAEGALHAGRMPVNVYEDADFEDRRLTLWLPTDASRTLDPAEGWLAILTDNPSHSGHRAEKIVLTATPTATVRHLLALVQADPAV